MTARTVAPIFASPEAPPMLIFGGKGGVGKTTLACATALHHAVAEPGERVLLVSTDPAHSVRDALGDAPIPGNLEVVEMDAAAEHAEFMAAHSAALHEIASRGTFLDDSDIERFLELSVPGVDELMCFVRLARWLEEDRAARYIVDTAPTGHALRLLSLPDLLRSWFEAIDALLGKHRYMASLFGSDTDDPIEAFVESLSESFQRVADTWADPARCRFVPVCNAEPLSLAETQRLLLDLETLEIDAPEVVINRLVPAGTTGPLGDLRARQGRLLGALGKPLAERSLWAVPLLAAEPQGSELQGVIASLGAAPRAGTEEGVSLEALPEVRGVVELPVATPGLLIVAGKGGVGKTTVSSAVAAALAERGQRVLLVSTDPAGSLGDAFGREIGAEPVALGAGLSAMQVDAESEFAALKDEYQDELEAFLDGLTRSVSLAFEHEALEHLLDLAPTGLDEVMALVRVVELFEEGGRDLIVLDTAPTGHLLRLLELPKMAQAWLDAIFDVFLKYEEVFRLPRVTDRLLRLARGIRRLEAMLTSPSATRLLAVAIPTRVCAAETARLVDACSRMGVGLGGIVVNQITPPGDDALARAMMERERPVLECFQASAGEVATVLIERGREPQGIDDLRSMGRRLVSDTLAARRAA